MNSHHACRCVEAANERAVVVSSRSLLLLCEEKAGGLAVQLGRRRKGWNAVDQRAMAASSRHNKGEPVERISAAKLGGEAATLTRRPRLQDCHPALQYVPSSHQNSSHHQIPNSLCPQSSQSVLHTATTDRASGESLYLSYCTFVASAPTPSNNRYWAACPQSRPIARVHSLSQLLLLHLHHVGASSVAIHLC